jgi:drug/metabolite transporter (DMT)-like permease
MKLQGRTYGLVFIMVGLFSTVFAFSKTLILPEGPLDGLSYSFVRSLFASIVLTFVMASRGLFPAAKKTLQLRLKSWLAFTLVSYLAYMVLIMYAGEFLTATDQTILNSLSLPFVVTITAASAKQKPSPALAGVVILNVIGGVLPLFSLNSPEGSEGALIAGVLALTSVFLNGFFPLLNKRFTDEGVDPIVTAYLINLLPCIATAPLMLLPGEARAIAALTPVNWGCALWIGACVSAFGYLFGSWAYKDKALTPEIYSLFTTLVPIGNIALDVLISGTILTPFRVLGAAIVVGSVVLQQVVQARSKKVIPAKELIASEGTDEKEKQRKEKTGSFT